MNVTALNFDIRGSIFSASGQHKQDPANPGYSGNIVFNFGNSSGDWVDVVVEDVYPGQPHIVFTTGRIANSGTHSRVLPLINHSGQTLKIIRWRPGAFGIAGCGGGELFFVVPKDGDVEANIGIRG